jgi:leader peptidase (prepilin peptidase) / N-methyltransferase
VAGAAAAALLGQQLGGDPALPLFVAVSVLCVLLGAIDLRCQRLPNVLVEPAIVIFTLAFCLTAAVADEWGRLGRALLGAVVLGAVFGVLYLLPGGLGLGDVKVAGLLGLFLGWLGWGAVGLGALLPWLLNGPVVVGLLLARRVNRRTTLPFGPALMVGCLAALPVSEWLHLVARS